MADFRKKAGAFANRAAGKAKTFAVFAARKTKDMSHIAKLNVDIASERDTIKRAYNEIGKLYYETHREDPEGFFVQLCQEIDVAYDTIAAKEAEIVRLKTQAEGAEQDDAAAAESAAAPDAAPEEPPAAPEDGAEDE